MEENSCLKVNVYKHNQPHLAPGDSMNNFVMRSKNRSTQKRAESSIASLKQIKITRQITAPCD